MVRKGVRLLKKAKDHRIRHKVLYKTLLPLVRMFVKLKFNYKYKKAKKLPDNYIVVSNHTTDYDPLFVASSFGRQMYFVASEHITRWKKTYKFLNYTFAPIVRYKGTVGASTVMEILRKVKRGDCVCIFAEGVRSWTGETGDILPSTAKMIKSAKCGLVTYKITGGYFVSPIWGRGKCRKGYVSGSPVKVYTPQELANMSEDEIYSIIKNDLYENAHDTQNVLNKKYKGKNIAEGLENLIFKCPHCKSNDTLNSKDNTLTCANCNKAFSLNEYGKLNGVSYKNIYELANWQDGEIIKDIKNNSEYVSDGVLNIINRDHTKSQIACGDITLTPNNLKCGNISFDINNVTDLAIYGKYGLVFSANGEYYELLPNKNKSVYKFLVYYKHIKNMMKG